MMVKSYDPYRSKILISILTYLLMSHVLMLDFNCILLL